MKNIMILCLMAPLVAFAQYESRSITVYGTAQQEIKPDEIWIDVHFEEHTKLKNSLMDDQVKEFQLILSKWDISQDNVEMTDFTSSRIPNACFPCGFRMFPDLLITKGFTIDFPDLGSGTRSPISAP